MFTPVSSVNASEKPFTKSSMTALLSTKRLTFRRPTSFSNLPNPPSIAAVRPEIFDVTIAALDATLALLIAPSAISAVAIVESVFNSSAMFFELLAIILDTLPLCLNYLVE